MKNIYTRVSLHIIVLFIISIALSMVPGELRSFFNDWQCEGSGFYNKNPLTQCDVRLGHGPTWHWGYQHWLWFFMNLLLFITQAVKVCVMISKSQKDQ